MITILAFLLTISCVVWVHEWGHYQVARACNIKVLKFSLGFGKTLFRWQRGDTEFALSLLPFGGYVRMLDEREGTVSKTELHLAFNRKPLWQKAAVVSAGPLANLLLAVILYACVHLLGMQEIKPVIGEPLPESAAAAAGLKSGDWIQAGRLLEPTSQDSWTEIRSISDLRWILTQATLDAREIELNVADRHGLNHHFLKIDLPKYFLPKDVDSQLLQKIGLVGPYSAAIIESIVPNGPADQAELLAGDQILKIENIDIKDAADFKTQLNKIPLQTTSQISLEILRKGQHKKSFITPKIIEENGHKIRRIEAMIGSNIEQVKVQYGFFEAFSMAFQKTWEISKVSLTMLGNMLTGQASLKNLSGPITIADYAGQTAKLGLTYYLNFLALVSVSLGVLNLLPIPMLDGGHLAYYFFETLAKRPISSIWLERFQRGGLAIMIMMMALAFYNDIARLFGI